VAIATMINLRCAKPATRLDMDNSAENERVAYQAIT